MMLQKQLRDAQETRQEEQQSGCRPMFLVGLPLCPKTSRALQVCLLRMPVPKIPQRRAIRAPLKMVVLFAIFFAIFLTFGRCCIRMCAPDTCGPVNGARITFEELRDRLQKSQMELAHTRAMLDLQNHRLGGSMEMIAYFKSVVEGSHRDTGKEKDMLMEQLQVRGRGRAAAARGGGGHGRWVRGTGKQSCGAAAAGPGDPVLVPRCRVSAS